MTVLFNGIVVVTGEHDTGKTTFAINCGAKPKDICFVDNDIKGSLIAKQLPFGKYINLVSETTGMKEIEYHKHCLKIIEEIKKSKYEAVIWDTWSDFSDTMHPFVVSNPSSFRQFWSPRGDIKGSEMHNVAGDYEAKIINGIKDATQMLILCLHLKPENVSGVRTGRMIPDSKKVLNRIANMRLWLMHGSNGSSIPIGLVLKRIAKYTVDESGSITTVSVLPRKIVDCTWEKIRWYWDNPIGNREPSPSETPNEFELSILDGVLTQEQKQFMKMAFESRNDEKSEEADETKKVVLELKESGKSIPAIASQLGLTVPDVVRMLNG